MSQPPSPPPASGLPDAADLDRKLERMLELMKRLARVMRAPDDGLELTPTQLLVLFHLEERGEVRIGALASAVGGAQNTISEVVSRLERAGMVRKARDAADRRAVVVGLAPRGRAAIERRKQTMVRHYQALFELLTETQRRRFIDAFEVLIETLERAHGLARTGQARGSRRNG
jgi:DNA-binding MarR family transcriptional regulator